MPGAGSGSSDAYDGAKTLFDKVNGIAKELHLIPNMGAEASAKGAAEAFAAARDGALSPNQALFGDTASIHSVPSEFPRVEMTGLDNGKMPGADASLGQMGKAINDFMSGVGDMMGQIAQGPLGFLGAIFSFLGKLFTDFASNIGEALTDSAEAVASQVADVWKKKLLSAPDAGTASLPNLSL